MKRYLAPAILLCATTMATHAADKNDWYIITDADGAYAYDRNAIKTDPKTRLRDISVMTYSRGAYANTLFVVNCLRGRSLFGGRFEDDGHAESMAWSELNVSGPYDPIWKDTSDDGLNKIATDIACARRRLTPIHIGDELATRTKLKSLSE